MISAEPTRLTIPTRGEKLGTLSVSPSDFVAMPAGIPFIQGGGMLENNGDTLAQVNALGYSPTSPTLNSACNSAASALGALAQASLWNNGCYASGSSVLIPPAYGTYGTNGRNLFHNPNFRTFDFSVFKDFKIKERVTAQFRARVLQCSQPSPLRADRFGPLDQQRSVGCGNTVWRGQRNPGPSRGRPGTRLGQQPRHPVGLEDNLLSPAKSSDRVLSCISTAEEAGAYRARLFWLSASSESCPPQ